jgi:hypothetical protein
VVVTACALSSPARGQDSLRVTNEIGLVSDYTNQIFYEQTFDSTVVTGRVAVADPRARVVAEAVTRVFGARGRVRFDVQNAFGAGPTVLRDALRATGTVALSSAFRARLEGEFDGRKDDTFDTRRQDGRIAGGASLLWTSEDRATAARAFGRAEALRSKAGTLVLFPDYDHRQVGLELDRFGLLGHGSLVYAYGTRAFPDTAARDYREHTLALDGRASVTDAVRLELNAFAERRVARRDSAVGDRFAGADGELGLVVRRGETLEYGPRARVRGQSFDAPTPTFFDAWIWRYAFVLRRLPDVLTRLELRPEVEFLSTPHFGGLPGTASAEDRRAVANEEYDQLALTAEAERLGGATWWWGTLAGGHRRYLDDGEGPNDLSARSSFWYAEASAYADRKLSERLRLRATADVRREFHRIAADDLTSLDLSLDLRVRL